MSLYQQLIETHQPQTTIDKECDLADKAREGDTHALGELALTCHKLLIKLASKLTRPTNSEYDTLLIAGYEAIYKAAETFDCGLNKRARFSTFAYSHIYGAMLRTWHNVNTWGVAVPYKYRPILAKKNADGERLSELSTQELYKLAEEYNVTLTTLRSVLEASKNDHANPQGDPESVSAEDQYFQITANDDLCKAVTSLPPQEQFVICHVFGVCGFPKWSADEVGVAYGLSKSRVSQLKRSAVGMLRDDLGEEFRDLWE